MEAKLIEVDNDFFVIEWSDVCGNGQITGCWENGKWNIDSELLGIKTMIKIIKSIKDD